MTIALDLQEHADPPLTIDDRYSCVDVLGRGRHATVWRAIDERLGRQVAVKVFRTSSGAHAADARDSVQAMARLVHPNIVRMFDGGRCRDSNPRRPYLVLELVGGRTLASSRDRLSMAQIGHVGLAVAGALAHIHGQGAVHAEIRPSNILLPGTGRNTVQASAAKLCELGMLDTVDLRYAAPEQRHGEIASAAGDIYSLGVLLGEALADDDRDSVDLRVVDLFRPRLAVQWQGLHTWMCDADPAARPSATEVAGELAALLSDQVDDLADVFTLFPDEGDVA